MRSPRRYFAACARSRSCSSTSEGNAPKRSVLSSTAHSSGRAEGGGPDAIGSTDSRLRRWKGVFVEGVRLFVVLLATAAGFLVARDLPMQSQGLIAMIGCLFGYVTGGMFGRAL